MHTGQARSQRAAGAGRSAHDVENTTTSNYLRHITCHGVRSCTGMLIHGVLCGCGRPARDTARSSRSTSSQRGSPLHSMTLFCERSASIATKVMVSYALEMQTVVRQPLSTTVFAYVNVGTAIGEMICTLCVWPLLDPCAMPCCDVLYCRDCFDLLCPTAAATTTVCPMLAQLQCRPARRRFSSGASTRCTHKAAQGR